MVTRSRDELLTGIDVGNPDLEKKNQEDGRFPQMGVER